MRCEFDQLPEERGASKVVSRHAGNSQVFGHVGCEQASSWLSENSCAEAVS